MEEGEQSTSKEQEDEADPTEPVDEVNVDVIVEEEHPECSEEIDEYEDENVLPEPKFKYKPLEDCELKRVFDKHIACCVLAHDKFLAIGTQSGHVIVADHLGNIDHRNVPIYRPHRCAVTRLSTDIAGHYILSCSSDGKVVIHGIGSTELNHVLTVKYIPRAVALSEMFSKQNSGQQFLVGERNLILYEKRFLKYRETVLFGGAEKDGFITRISWKGNYIAFTNEQGTSIFDKVMDRTITLVAPSHDVDRLRSTRFPAVHCWLDNDTIAIGWADTVTIAKIVTVEENGRKHRRGEVHYSWKMDKSVSGIAYTLMPDGRTWCDIIVFGLKPGDESESGVDAFCDIASVASFNSAALTGPAPCAIVATLEPLELKQYRQTEDTLKFETKPHSLPSQFHMAGLPEYNLYFLVGPHQIVTMVPCSAEDVVRWRIKNSSLEAAWEYSLDHADEIEDSSLHPQLLGRYLIEDLIKKDNISDAVNFLPDVCGESKSEWEYFVDMFEDHHLTSLLADVLPTNNPQLEPECYEYVLHAALYNTPKLFRKLVYEWNPDIYRIAAMAAHTCQRIHDAAPPNSVAPLTVEEEFDLYCALADLYIADRQYGNALKIYFSNKDKRIFQVIRKHQLFEMVKDQITELMDIDTDQAHNLLLSNEELLPPAEVMTKITRQPKLQLAYLKKLFDRQAGIEFSDLAVKLFAEYDRPSLLPFLRKNKHYHINKALSICSDKNFIEEKIFLLAKSGNRKEALNLMINIDTKLEKAVDFCKEHDDEELWTLLINEAIKSPAHVAHLLLTAGSCIDPFRIIQEIPEDMDIPNLRDAIVKILRDYEVQTRAQEGCHAATLLDVTNMFDCFRRSASRAMYFGSRASCALCKSAMFSSSKDRVDEWKLFGCSHAVHTRCCTEMERRLAERSTGSVQDTSCPVCSDDTGDFLAEY